MSARRVGVFAVVVSLGLAVGQPAGAASPTAVLEAFFEGTNAVLKTVDPFGDLEQPRQAVRELVYEVFDFQGASALALGSAWLSRTPDEQDEFVRLFAVFLERGFIGVIGAKASVSDGVKIQYVDESIGDEWAGVATSLLTRNGQELTVDYWFVRRGDRWKVQDVVIDGVSLIANYRSQFTRVLAAYPYSEVLARLGGSRPDAPAMVAAPVPAAQAEPAVPRIPPVTQSQWSANAAAPPPAAGTALSPRTLQEIHLTALPSEVSFSARGQTGFIAEARD
jgi:phospholipid transport system substrate-binding protein